MAVVNLLMPLILAEAMIHHFEMIDLGLMSYFLGIEISQIDHGIFITQKKYA